MTLASGMPGLIVAKASGLKSLRPPLQPRTTKRARAIRRRAAGENRVRSTVSLLVFAPLWAGNVPGVLPTGAILGSAASGGKHFCDLPRRPKAIALAPRPRFCEQ